MKITLEFDNLDLLEGGGDLWIEPGSKCPKIVKSRRVLDMNNEKNWQQERDINKIVICEKKSLLSISY